MSNRAKTKASAKSASPPSASYATRKADAWLFAGFLLWTFTSLVYPLMDTDFWWHLKTGEWIIQHKTVPQTDLYTFTDGDKPWIDLHWGFQLFITLIYRLGGANLVILAKAAVITAAVAVGWLAAGRSLPGWVKAFLWALPVISISGRGYERPEMFSQLFLAAWLAIAFQVEQRPRLIWLLPAVQLVWVNMHALFVLGLIVGGCYVADLLAREWARGRFGLKPPASQPTPRAIIRSGGLVVVACFANPYFEEGALFPLTLYRKFTVDQDFYSRNIGEFEQPIQFFWRHGLVNMYQFAAIGIWLLTAASFVLLLASRRRWSVLRLGLFFAFSHLAWEATRNANLFGLVAGVILCANVGDALETWIPLTSSSLHSRLSKIVGVGITGLIALVVTGLWNQWGDGNKPFRLGEAKSWFIHEAAKFAGQPGFPERAFVANNGQAAVYTYHNSPERLVFMDARLEVCTRETFELFNLILGQISTGNPAWQALFDPKGVDLPVVILDSRYSRPAIQGMLANPGWRLVFADKTAAVFLDNARAEKLKLPGVSPEPLMYPDKD